MFLLLTLKRKDVLKKLYGLDTEPEPEQELVKSRNQNLNRNNITLLRYPT
jgi:hypothetical protein